MHIYTSISHTKYLGFSHICYLLPCPFSLKERTLHMKTSYQCTVEKTTDYLLQNLQRLLLCQQCVTPCAAKMRTGKPWSNKKKKTFSKRQGWCLVLTACECYWRLGKLIWNLLSLTFELFFTTTITVKSKEVLRAIWIQAFCHAKWIHSVVTWLIYVPAGYSLEIT